MLPCLAARCSAVSPRLSAVAVVTLFRMRSSVAITLPDKMLCSSGTV